MRPVSRTGRYRTRSFTDQIPSTAGMVNWKLQGLREGRALTQEELAEKIGVNPVTYRRWEAGTRPQPHHVRVLRDFFRVEVDELGFGRGLVGENRQPAEVEVHQSQAADPDAGAMEAFRVADRQIGGGHMYSAVVSYLANSVGPRLLTGRVGDFAAAASLTSMAGWMAHDAGRDREAQGHFERAGKLSEVGDALELRADVAAATAHLEMHLGTPAAAIETARAARDQLARAARHPALFARLHAMEARGLAALGRGPEAARSLNEAEAALGSRDGEASHWVAPFDEASLASEAARALHDAGDFDAARRAAERVIQLRPSDRARSRALAQLQLALTALHQPRPDPVEACSLARQVAGTASTVSSARIAQALREIHELLEPHRAVSEVADYLETALAGHQVMLRGG